jgi:hypothetical protein
LVWGLAKLYDGSDRLELKSILCLINEVAVKHIPVRLYEHLLLFTTGNKAQQVQVYETMVNASQFKEDSETWVAYF